MDLSFLRNQIKLKLNEFENLNNLYVEGLEKEFKAFGATVSEEENKEISDLLEELKSFSENSKEVSVEFEITVGQLTILYQEIYKKFKGKAEAQQKNLTTTFENISVSRRPLQYSTLADSAGYNTEQKLMDLAFKGGSIYRYYNVPVEFYEKITSRNNLKGMRKELDAFDFKKIV